ncbi:methyltransferase domain-containing protein [Dactylosporangium sp. NPDC051485]|uniref:methyltransferase domain-containing protein n=1 Tax=Dactylosporangium sp. NPDC051485 TaxID=3154846 RepID=UPI003440A244
MESSAPRTAVVWQVLRRELERAGRPLTVLDVGGGTGGFAVPLARAGHTVTVVDASPDALAALIRRAAEAGVGERVRAVQGDADGLADQVGPDTIDLALCHSVLEVVDDPHKAVAALAGTLRPGGAASVVVANRAAAVLARAIGGHLAAASVLLASPDGRTDARDRLRRRYTADSATALLDECGLTVEQVHGVRVVADLVPGTVAESEPEALAAFELALAGLPPYRDIATQLHLLARRGA